MAVEDTTASAAVRRGGHRPAPLGRRRAGSPVGSARRPAPTVRNPHPTTAPPGHGVPRQDRQDLIQLS